MANSRKGEMGTCVELWMRAKICGSTLMADICMQCIEMADSPDGDGDGAAIARHLQLLGMRSCVRM